MSLSAITAITMQPIPLLAAEDKTSINNDALIQNQVVSPPATTTSPAATTTEATTISPSCGQVVNGNVKLTSSLNCSTDGIIVGADSITIDLNGYTINGPGVDSSKVGVMIPHNSNIVVKGPGTVKNFQAGILVTGASQVTVNSLSLQENQIAIFTTGATGLNVNQNIIKNNNIGIAGHSTSDSFITQNLMVENNLAGVTLVNSDGTIIDFNNVIKGGSNGVFLDSQSNNNKVENNNILKNPVDLNNANGLSPNINSNSFTKNNCDISNPSGLCIGG